MKSLLTLILTVFLLASCEQAEDRTESSVTSSINYQTLTIDGCEYIIFRQNNFGYRGFGYMAHKGNCRNPIHIYKK